MLAITIARFPSWDSRAQSLRAMQQPILWTIALAALAIAAVGVAVWLTRPRKHKHPPLPTDWAVGPRPVFSSDERRVYRQLREALPHHIVLAKLPLVRFCQPTDPQEVHYWYQLLGATHVTFAVCSANGRVLAAIDLDGDRASSRRVLQIKQNVLGACRVRYLRCPVDHLPSIPELQLLVPNNVGATRGTQPSAGVTTARDSASANTASRRRERSALWHDSGFFQDSFFGVASLRDAQPQSGFGGLGPESPQNPAGPPVEPPDDIGGVVVESAHAPAPTRH
jgi:Protein of unknown function (DUF2726)